MENDSSNIKVKVIVSVIIVSLFCLLSFIAFKEVENSNRQKAIESSIVDQKQLVDGIVRSKNEFATKEDIENYAKNHNLNIKAIQNDMDKLHAEISAINSVSVVSNHQVYTNLPSTSTGYDNPNPVLPVCKDGSVCPNADPFGYLQKQQKLSLNEDFGQLKLPIGNVGFSAWQNKPWSIDIKEREYRIDTVIGRDENQRVYFYNKFSVNIDGQKYDLPIKAETKEIYPEATFSWFNPRLFLGVDSGVNLTHIAGEFAPSINVGLMSYGQYKNSPDFSILQIGAGYSLVNRKPQFILTPVMYNIGKHIPLMSNVYIGPSFQVDISGNLFIMAGIRVGL